MTQHVGQIVRGDPGECPYEIAQLFIIGDKVILVMKPKHVLARSGKPAQEKRSQMDGDQRPLEGLWLPSCEFGLPTLWQLFKDTNHALVDRDGYKHTRNRPGST
jgi:hypothetical protein